MVLRVLLLELQTIHWFSQSQRRPLLTRAFSLWKAPIIALTFKTLLRHYVKQAPKHGK